MKILFLTQYFPPEVGAPQNRIAGLALNLKKLGAQVDILTGLPNYPGGKVFKKYNKVIFSKEKFNILSVYRTWLFTSVNKRNIMIRLLNYFSFTVSSFFVGLFLPRYDMIIVESPPLFLGITGFLLSKIKKNKFVFNVSDLWPESVVKLGYITNRFIISVFTRLENWIYKKADLITVQTDGIFKNIKIRIKDKSKLYLLYNGIDVLFWKKKIITKKFVSLKTVLKNNFVCGYIGNHGYAQGLEVILKAAQKLQNYKIKFLLVGDGPKKNRLIETAMKMNLHNIIFHPPVKKEYVPEILSYMDVTIVPLKDIDLFKGAIPSKMFEFLAAAKPVLLGVRGEAEELLKKAQAGMFFRPDNSNSLVEKILWLLHNKRELKKMGEMGRNFVFKNFNRAQITEKFYQIIKEI